MYAVQTRQLTRTFAGGQGVHALDLAVPVGSVYGFLGPNGAGKTTTIRLLLGLLRPASGTLEVCGRPLRWNARDALTQVGSMVESPSLYPHLSGRDNLEVTRRLLDAPRVRIDEVLDITGLTQDARRRVREYSLGMRQRLGIAQALLNQPRLLILDEPTNGLDPAGIAEMRGFITRMASELGLSVFLSTHLLGEVEQMATHVGVIHAGCLLFQGTLDALREHAGENLDITGDDSAKLCRELQILGESPVPLDSSTVRLTHPRHADHLINRHLVLQGLAVHALHRHRPSLESLFFGLTAQAREVK